MRKFFGRIICVFLYAYIFLLFLGHVGKGNFFYSDIVDEKLSVMLEKYKNKVDIIVAGDSRAWNQVIPQVIDERTGLTAISIAAPSYHLPGIYNHLKKRKMLDKQYILLISISTLSINDGIITEGYLPYYFISYMSWRDRCTTFGGCFSPTLRDTYFHYFILRGPHEIFMTRFLAARDILFKVRKGTMNDDIFLWRGFMPLDQEPKKDPLDLELAMYPRNGRLDGIKWKVYQKNIEALSKSKCQILFFQPPLAPIAKSRAYIRDSEQQLKELMKDEAAKYKNIHFIDFYNNAKTEKMLPNELYADGMHVNHKGAEVFTNLLVDKLFERGLLTKKEK